MRVSCTILLICLLSGGFCTYSLAAGPCPVGDLDSNCRVDANDLRIFAEQWLLIPDTCTEPNCADFDQIVGVNMIDFAMLARNWHRSAFPVVINEFMAANSSTIEDPCETGEYPDWVELYNASILTVDVGGLHLTDNFDQPTKWRIPDGVSMGPWEHLLIWADEDPEQGPLHADFKLSSSGERIGLYDSNGIELIDSVIFGEQISDISYGRYPDGTDQWRSFGASEPAESFNLMNVDIGALGQDVKEHFLALGLDVADRRYSVQFDDTNGLPEGVVVALETTNPSDDLEFSPTERDGEPLAGDYVMPDRYPGGIRLTITGLEPNDYTLTSYHNNPGTARSDFDVYVDGAPYSANNPQTIVDEDALAAKVTTEFTLSGSDDDIMIEFVPVPPASNNFYRVQLNGFELANDQVIPSAPSPGSQNSGGYMGVVEDVKFSKEHGFYDTAFEVVLICDTDDAVIRYTTDGSWPDANSTEYVGPIDVNGTTCLRAAAFKTDWLSSPTQTRTYIFLDDVLTQTKPPGFNDEIDWDMDPNIVNDPCYGGEIMKNALKSIPTLSIVMDYNDVFGSEYGTFLNGGQCGGNWPYEQMASVELIYPDGREGFSTNCGVQPHGALRTDPLDTRHGKKHSMDLIFKGMYGPTKLRYPFFESDILNSDSATDVYDKMVLRAGWGMSWATTASNKVCYTRDQWSRDAQIEMSGIGSHGAFFHLYLNGLYFGLYNAAEETNHRFAASYLGGTDEDYFAVKASIERNCPGNIIAGDRTRFDEMITRAEAKDLADPNRYAEFTDLLDIDHFIEYLMILWYIGGGDMYDNNWLGTMRTYPPEGFMWYCWDTESSWGVGGDVPPGSPAGGAWFPYYFEPSYHDANPSDLGVSNRIAKVWRAVQDNADFRMRLADGVYRHCFNGGLLTDENSIQRWNALNESVREAVIPESARWGDSLVQPARNPQDHWIPAVQDVCDLMVGNVAVFISALRDYGYYPDIDPPVFNQHGGQVVSGFGVTLTNPNGSGTIYYTLDGTDPRETVTGSPVGTSYGGTITLNQSTQIKTRVFDDPNWSALAEVKFVAGQVAQNVRISEIMYHPLDANDPNDPNTEYIELTNLGPETINLNLVEFTNGIDFTFPSTSLASGEHVLVVKDQNAFEARYGTGRNVAGEYLGSLNNGGERIELEDPIGQTIHNFRYSDGWRGNTDGEGYSLTIIDPANSDPNSWDEKDSWRPSAYVKGSPDWDDSGIVPNPGAIVINEVLAHSDGYPNDWIELHNTTGGPIDISGWFISDNDSNLTKYQIQSPTIILGGQYLVLTQDDHFGNAGNPGSNDTFGLSEHGEEICLNSGIDSNGVLTGYRQKEDFGASENGVSFGRYYKASTDNYNFVAMDSNTPGTANAYPMVGPIVINEIMYHPDWPTGSPYDNDQYEYIELYNITGSDVNLYDEDSIPWKFTDGIDYTFTTDANIPAGGYALVVKDPTAFAWLYGTVGVQIFGPYDGRLSNGGEKLELSMPGDLDGEGIRHYIRIDRVNYDDGSDGLWPVGADGGGASLGRITPANYGNDPNNWDANTPSPGL